MEHLPKLIEDLGLILLVGAIVTLLFRRIKQPLVLGYILAGFLVSPHVTIFPSVMDEGSIKIWAEIGVIFLLFSLGLEFSFKKLMRVGGAASITALIEIVFVIAGGYLLGKKMGWNTMDSLFLGGLLASSSTTIILRAFDELGVKRKHFATVVFGVLIVEDIVAILLMVLLSTMAVSKQFEGMEMLLTLLKLLFFLALWFIAGIFLLPTFLRRIKKLIDEETLLILALGLCLGMVMLATKTGFSAELGAFVMGSILAETTSAEKIEHLIKPVKDLFGAVFFISVGMMIDPKAIVEYRMPILWIVLFTVFGKFFSTLLGALLSGQPLKQSVQVGMSMAQIGEFAFIIVALGINLKVTGEFLFPIAVGVSAITTFTTPYMIKYADKMYALIVKIAPKKWISGLNKYSGSAQNIQAESKWKKVIRSLGITVVTNIIVINAIYILSIKFLIPFLSKKIDNVELQHLIAASITFIAIFPFLWALMARKPSYNAYKELWLNTKYSKGPLLILEISRIVLGILIVGGIANSFFSEYTSILIAVVALITALFIFSKKIQAFYSRIEKRFLTNLNAREAQVEDKTLRESYNDLSAWDMHITDFIIHPRSDFIGMPLMELKWREKYGINIAYIERGDKLIYAPVASEKLYPYDHIGIIATDEQLQSFKPVIQSADEQVVIPEHDLDDVVLHKIIVDERTQLQGLDIKRSGIREKTNGLVIGIERNGNRIISPESNVVLQRNDIVWIVGNKQKIKNLFKRL
ncbi:MAG: cation:proton antiporter [Chitinophagaceae bacterium]|jgi:CPA2 family monovalent cation:H+ antiporter-2|nr:cation:proton antiporter [Chitinophagaceae bacterium]